MKEIRIAPLVEVDGEVEAVPVLVRRIIREIDPQAIPAVARGFRHPSASIRKPGGLERAVSAVGIRNPGYSILVLIDCEDDCPKDLAKEFEERVRVAHPDLRVSIVFAYREYESWFLAGAESLRGKRNLRPELTYPDNMEDIRDAKGWLSRNLVGRARYSPTQDQAALSNFLDLEIARSRSRSFRKLWKEVYGMVNV